MILTDLTTNKTLTLSVDFKPSNPELVEPPILSIGTLNLLNFRNYYYTDTQHTQAHSNPGQVSIHELTENPQPPLEIVRQILSGLDLDIQTVEAGELNLMEAWVCASTAFYH